MYATNSLPPQLAESLKFHPSGQYYPPLYLNKFWQLKDKMIQINETVKELPLNITFSTLSNFKFQLYHQMEKSFDMQQSFGSMVRLLTVESRFRDSLVTCAWDNTIVK